MDFVQIGININDDDDHEVNFTDDIIIPTNKNKEIEFTITIKFPDSLINESSHKNWEIVQIDATINKQIENAIIEYKTIPTNEQNKIYVPSEEKDYVSFQIYAMNYNVLRIMSGMAKLCYSS